MINLRGKPTLQGDKIILRPFEREDIQYMIECLKDPEVLKFTGSTAIFHCDAIVEWYNTRNSQSDRLDLAIVDKDKNIAVGEVVLNEYNEDKHSMNFRILIGPRGRDRGLGTEATQLIIDYIFLNTSIKQVTLGVYVFNPRARRVYDKIGFVVESIDIGDLEFEGEMIDAFNMVLTREKWKKECNK